MRFDGRNTQFWRAKHQISLLRDPVAVQEDIDKAGTGDFHFAGNVAEIKQLHHFFCQLARRHAEFLGDGHHTISLIVAELRFGGLTDLRFAIGWRACGNQRLADFI